jgi:alkylhydroperoxidase/carboxymuconolactone decarboxylase family protein YurZ
MNESARPEELMNPATALAAQCVPCVVHQTKMNLRQGATREEMPGSALGVVDMGGGPAPTQTVCTLDALDTWAGESDEADAKAQT